MKEKILPTLTVILLFFIVILLYKIYEQSNHPSPPAPKPENSAVQVIGRFPEIDPIGNTYSTLLVFDAGTLRTLPLERGSRLDIMIEIPKFLKKIWVNGRATYEPIPSKMEPVVEYTAKYGYYAEPSYYVEPVETEPDATKK